MEEAWSQSYKKSIDCSNPKGFSQKAHSVGPKKQINDSTTIVYILSNYAHIGHKGIPAPCCNNGEYRLPYNIKRNSLKTIWNSKAINKVREQFTLGHCPKGCEHCFRPESEGVSSFRQKALRGTFGTNDPFEDTIIRGLDLRMGNTCN